MNTKSFILLVVLIMTFHVRATTRMELKPLLELKSNHYLELNLYYTSLSKAVKTGQDKLFCQEVRGNVDLLNSILEHDLVLIKTLKTFTDSDYLNFATHLEENSFSPLFSSLSHRELCDQSRQEDILGLALSLEYHVMNIDYLYMSNLLFMGSINSI